MKKDMLVLGIETSCDETSASVVRNGREVLSNVISSQIDLHQKYGGVVPEIASRKHVELIIPVIDQAIKEASIKKEDLDVLALTYGPGLVGALLVGLTAGKALAFALKKPIVGVHHIEGHIAANYINHPELKPPFICLVASGGHSHIVRVLDYDKFEIIGKTRDDAAGEAFDKVARTLGLGYPGGPLIDKISKTGNPLAIEFPKTNFGKGIFDYSFSGIKTAVINYINHNKMKNQTVVIADVAASFQEAVTSVLTTNLINAAMQYGVDTIALAGGVAANSVLREKIGSAAVLNNLKFYYPEMILCTDNAAMIACAGYYEFMNGKTSDLSLNAVPNLKLGER